MLIGICLSFTMGLFENLSFPVFILATLTKLSFPVYVSSTIPRGHDKGGLLSSVMLTKSPFVRFCYSTWSATGINIQLSDSSKIC